MPGRVFATLLLFTVFAPIHASLASEPSEYRPVAPAAVDSESIAFDLRYAPGVRFEVIATPERGVRDIRISGCGRTTNATHIQRVDAYGYILVAYETNASKQNGASCVVDVILRFTCARFGARSARSWAASVIFQNGRFYVLNEEPEERCTA